MSELTFAVRMLLKTPFVTAVAVLSLGLGIGANAAIFSLFNHILLRPLPVESPEQLVNLAAPGPKSGSTSCNNSGNCEAIVSYPMFLDLTRDQQVFTGIAAHRIFGANIAYQGETMPVDGAIVSGTYFGVLGVRPVIGRLLQPPDTTTIGEMRVAVLAYDYWKSRFNLNQGIVGETLVVNGHPLSVVGVAAEGFDGTTRGTRVKIFVPITLRSQMEPPFMAFEARNNYWVYLFARLKPGVTIDAARAGLNGTYRAIITQTELPLQTGTAEQYRAEFAAKQMTVEDGRRGQSYIFGQASTPLLVLQIVTGVVLLIACANIANLLLARAAGRAAEMAVRLSIGASRGRLIRQLLIESCLLAGLGGLAGLLFLQWTVSVVTARLPFGSLGPAVSRVGLGVLLFAGALSMVTGVLFGLFPALQATRPDLAITLKNQAGQPSGARGAARFRSALVVIQIALSMGLLSCAGLFTRSLLNVSRVDLGVDVDRVITFSLGPQRNGYTTARAQQLFEDVLGRLAATPGVTSVSAARVPLIANSNSSTSITVEGQAPSAAERSSPSPNYNEIAPAYFRTVGIPILSGRDFTAGDILGAPKVAIVNEAFVRRFKPGSNPVGTRMRLGGGDPKPLDIEIVGLVRDSTYSRVRDPVPPVFYLPYRQNERIGSLVFYARADRDPEAILATVKPLVASFDPNLPVQRLRTMPDQIADNVSSDRLMSVLSASFAALATALAAIGLYGVLAYTVSQRTREFGLRMALGAAPADVRTLVLRQVMWMTIIGGAIGLGLAIGAGHLARSQLFEMNSADPAALAVSTIALTLVALAAGFVPSQRASRVDPMRALKWE